MKRLFVLAVSLSAIVSCSAQEERLVVAEIPNFTELESWVNFVKRDDFTLLKSFDRKGYFVGVFKDSRGDLAICTYWKDNSNPKPHDGSCYDVQDLYGNSLHDTDSDRNPSIYRVLVIEDPQQEINWIDGTLFPLTKDAPDRARLIFRVSKSGGTWSNILDEVIELTQEKSSEQVGAANRDNAGDCSQDL
ncbi:hypothetical protein [Sulfuriroseicoccus oceanibius]|uniref:Uncharacterized protein n=1 Tax=Sulfuriroseicoccus oceanibius TaxID=2707525 RepID=A0A6B3L3E4_9BACT|nr:hypothetical protein [Sulfuriroseicoccus oceanibius]QQL44093.1 hypothetical protein G3M56_009320 [Sulfuriroseicoccus oceanibius]